MANANRRRLTSVVTGPGRTPSEKLGLIVDLLADPANITPAMLRVKILAICDGRPLPADPKSFLALAARAGVRHASRYNTWRDFAASQTGKHPAGSAEGDGIAVEPAPGTALYRYYDKRKTLLYIGISGRLPRRVIGHAKESSWMEFAASSTVEGFPSRSEAAAAEVAAIKAERPLFNQKHNNTPEARRRLIDYLVKQKRLDLLAPAVSRG